MYSGPIGAVLTPALNKNVDQWDDIASASSLCGACYEACPVKIPLHDMLVYLRQRKVESGATDLVEKAGMKGFNLLMSDAKRVKALIKFGRIGQKLLVRDGRIKARVGPLKGWNSYRYAPSLAKKTFRESWKDIEQGFEGALPELDSVMNARMEKLVAAR
ncbi:DUF3390 domain-containing protein [Paenibacillus sp. LMG 31460]|uniref:DUF3390 domain-containing protein n=1 Tax=Paenibacillus germinis TaxID=2654979 RepID=A0ABX1ZGE2_9BACL|nr:DUF3390 domain-containing protein [Paenibacillus germinis]